MKWIDFEVPLNYEENDNPFGNSDHYCIDLTKAPDKSIGINLVIPLEDGEYPRFTIEQFRQLLWAMKRIDKELKERKL